MLKTADVYERQYAAHDGIDDKRDQQEHAEFRLLRGILVDLLHHADRAVKDERAQTHEQPSEIHAPCVVLFVHRKNEREQHQRDADELRSRDGLAVQDHAGERRDHQRAEDDGVRVRKRAHLQRFHVQQREHRRGDTVQRAHPDGIKGRCVQFALDCADDEERDQRQERRNSVEQVQIAVVLHAEFAEVVARNGTGEDAGNDADNQQDIV